MRFVGIDLGTQSLKAVICDETFAVLGSHSIAYSTRYPAPGRAEQDPLVWEEMLAPAIAAALADAGATAEDVTSLALAGQLDGCVP
ncbi:MAG TPA: FGGY family carbohydrate kinase, partial [Kofleriaceae bacterium]|nr:FGGY family carbohydrate kinase [Kofleriaceae bacterium]